MGSLWCLMAFLIKGFSMTGTIMVRQHEAQTFAAFECTSHTVITINFFDLSNTTQTIADCDAQARSCHVYDTSLAKNYAVSYTDEGAFVYIKNTANTLGKYTCCETYNRTNCDSTELISFAAKDFNRSSYHIENKQLSGITETYQRGMNDCNQCPLFVESLRMVHALIISLFILILILITVFITRKFLKGRLLRIVRIKTSTSNVDMNPDYKNDAEDGLIGIAHATNENATQELSQTIVQINVDYTNDAEEVPMIKVDEADAYEDTLPMKDASRDMVTGLTPLGKTNRTSYMRMDSGNGSSGNPEIDEQPAALDFKEDTG